MKKIKHVVAIALMVSFLSGCSHSLQPANPVPSAHPADGTEQLTQEAVAGESENESENKEETEKSGEIVESAEIPAIDSVEKEFLLAALWGKMLQRLDSGAGNVYAESEWDRAYEVEGYLEDFTLDTFRYGVGLVYPEMAVCSYVYYWPDNISDVREAYQTASDQYALACYYGGQASYESNLSQIAEMTEKSVLQVRGQVTNESYEQANLFIDGIQPYTAYEMWGSVLQVAGNLYQENTGTMLGKLSGRAVLMDFDFERIAGTYWICLDGMEPKQVTLTFLNRDCGWYTLTVDEAAVFDDSLLDAGWMGLSFDLVTTRK